MNLQRITVVRFAHAPQGTFGRLFMPEFSCFTVERPWRNNEPFVSCIPPGEYDIRPARFWRGGYDCVGIDHVPGRSHILVHRANTPDDVQGCIGVGMRAGCVNGDWAVVHSRRAFDRFMDAFNQHQPRKITITDGNGADGWAAT